MLNCDNGTYDAWYWAHPPGYMPLNCNLDIVSEFKKYTKLKNALEIVSKQKQETLQELDYIETKYQTKETSGGNSNNSYVGCTITIPANSEAIITIKAKGKQQDKEDCHI